jgi:hypothetical protein
MTVAMTKADDTRRQDVYTTMSYILMTGKMDEVKRRKGTKGERAVPPRDRADEQAQRQQQQTNEPPALSTTPGRRKRIAPIDKNDVLHQNEGR